MTEWFHNNRRVQMMAAKAKVASGADLLLLEMHERDCSLCSHESSALQALVDVARSGATPPTSAAVQTRFREAFIAATRSSEQTASGGSLERTRKWRLPVAVATPVLAVTAAVLFFLSPAVTQDTARVTHLVGEVIVSTGEGEKSLLTTGMQVSYARGLRVRTGPHGSATFDFDRTGRLTMEPATSILLSEDGLSLIEGGVTVRSNGPLISSLYLVEVASYRLVADTPVEVRVWYDGNRGGVQAARGKIEIKSAGAERAIVTSGHPFEFGRAPSQQESSSTIKNEKPENVETPRGATVDSETPSIVDRSATRVERKPRSRASSRRGKTVSDDDSHTSDAASEATGHLARRAMEVAERHLLRREYRAAKRTFLMVSKSHRGTRFGEEALFIAADISWRKLKQPEQARLLLQRYQREHKQGRFRAEVRDLLLALPAEDSR